MRPFFLFASFAGHPSSSPFFGTCQKVLCSVERSAQHRAWRGAVFGWSSPQSSGRKFLPLVGKCSATRCSAAAPPPGARHGLGGPMHPRHPLRWQRERCDRGLWEGCSCDTPATHSELRNEPRQGCSYTVERDRGGVASAPLSSFLKSARKKVRRSWVRKRQKFVALLRAPPRLDAQVTSDFTCNLVRVHAKGVVLCERACFCLLSAFYTPPPF